MNCWRGFCDQFNHIEILTFGVQRERQPTKGGGGNIEVD